MLKNSQMIFFNSYLNGLFSYIYIYISIVETLLSGNNNQITYFISLVTMGEYVEEISNSVYRKLGRNSSGIRNLVIICF